MSIPKADKGLAEFVKTLDPSMYTISGGAPQSNPVANEVKALKEQQEHQWYQDQAIRAANQIKIPPTPFVPECIYTLRASPNAPQMFPSYPPERSIITPFVIGISVGAVGVLVIQSWF